MHWSLTPCIEPIVPQNNNSDDVDEVDGRLPGLPGQSQVAGQAPQGSNLRQSKGLKTL